MKNKNKHYLIFTMLAALLMLSACSASPQEIETAADSNSASSIEVVGDIELEPVEAPIEQAGEVASLGYIVADEGEMPLEVQLGVGILRLEEMGLGLTPDQVAGQLDLWTNAQSLVQFNDRNEDQISAICIEIQDGLTPEQLNALHSMNLAALTSEEAQQETSAYAQADDRNSGNGPPEGAGGQGPDRPEGDRPEGDRPEGERPEGQGGPGQGNPNARLSAMVANAIITYLQSL